MSLESDIKQPRYQVELVKASEPNGDLFYAYLLLPETLADTFREKLKTDNVELEKYGVVLASGKGHTPSQEHVDYINKRFG